jgi:hypothetical protein
MEGFCSGCHQQKIQEDHPYPGHLTHPSKTFLILHVFNMLHSTLNVTGAVQHFKVAGGAIQSPS